MVDKRVSFDFEVEFSNGGGIQGQGFRLDIDGGGIADDALAAYIVKDLRLLMVGKVNILNKQIIEEQHKRASRQVVLSSEQESSMIDLSHVIENGMITYKGLPAPLICDHISHIQSRGAYAADTEFQIGRIDMVANTGTYIDTPYHRYLDGNDLSTMPLPRMSNIAGVVVRLTGMETRSIDWTHFAAVNVNGRAVLVNTGWDRHWRSDQYFEGHPFLTKTAAEYLRDEGAVLVGIDSLNIDDTTDPARPVHSVLLGAGIPIVEHLTNLSALPIDGFGFWAVPPKIRGMGTFPVRAHAILDIASDS
ncbi:cyclase [Caballeronia mineralivorans PML1(12)]|uniref:Cyclase n=1 Tax=Caballeronia mineralivorans PML1(12) TaxID=908627 RepID=A0A0J1FX20_9BURK|nr:cyclase family protein [Caballeronia mineralivorans]KLU24473.1 cyclase [Caballeronia mineralivorans PML1(12)]